MINDILETGYTYKSGSFLNEFKIILENWKEDATIEKNFEKFQSQDLFGKNTDSWNKSVLSHIRKRYFKNDIDELKTLRKAIKIFNDVKITNELIYFHLGWSDLLFRNFIVDFLYPSYVARKIYVTTKDLIYFIDNLEVNQTEPRYRSKEVKRKVAGGLLSTCKDFGILKGHTKKKFLPYFLTDESFSYILYWLKQFCDTPREIITHFSWKFFFYSSEQVEKLLFKAHDMKLVLYLSKIKLT
jgi:hypothetical protein